MNLEMCLMQIYDLPHNQLQLHKDGKTTQQAIQEKLNEIRSGTIGLPFEEFHFGPKVFLRVVGKNNRVYSGEWWFDAHLFNDLEKAHARIHFSTSDKKGAIKNLLRELLAVSVEWNAIEEVWALNLPPGEKIKVFRGMVAPQKLLNNLPLSVRGNRLLVGQAKQYFIPVKNPFWIQKFSDF